MLQFADFCPVLILALVAGVISDRVNRKTWLIILQTGAGLLGAALAVAAFMGRATPLVVIAFTFLEGIVWALNGPVFLAVVPSLIPRGELDRPLALNSIQFNMARLCGPMLAAAIISVAGIAGAFTLNACTFISLLIVLLLFIPSTPQPPRTETTSIGVDIREGLRFVWMNQGTRRLTIMGLTFMFLSAPLQGLLPVFRAEGAERWARAVRADAFGDRAGVDPWGVRALVYSLVLSAPSSHSPRNVRFRGDRTAFQFLDSSGVKPGNSRRQRDLLAAEFESEQHRQPTSRHRCKPRAGALGDASRATRRHAAGPSVRGLLDAIPVSAVGAAGDARGVARRDAHLPLPARTRDRQNAPSPGG